MIKPATTLAIGEAVTIIRRGGIIAFPTETLYGLAVEAINRTALSRLQEVKGRDMAHTLPILVADLDMLSVVTATLSSRAPELVNNHWPGPLTLVLPARAGLPPQIVSNKGGVAVRISSDPVAAELIRQVGAPITATSANISGYPPATSAAEACIEGVELVLDDGPRGQRASTVVELLEDGPVVLRQGEIVIEEPSGD